MTRELKQYTEIYYRNCLLLVKIGRYKTLRYAVNALKDSPIKFSKTFREAINSKIEADELNKISKWKKLPRTHWRWEYVDLFNSDIQRYLDREYLGIGNAVTAYSPRYQTTKIYKEIEQLVGERFYV